MTTYLSDHQGRNNNFNLIRFIAAFLVLVSHSYALTLGSGEYEPLVASLGFSLGAIAVDVFFVTSGYLVAASLFRGRSIKSFIVSRVLRIYPALLVVITISIFLIGPFFTTLPLDHYFSDPQTYTHFFKNVTLLFGVEYQLPGVFESAPYADAVNGSLWTLPYEIRLYCVLAVLGFLSIILSSYTSFKNIPSLFLTLTFCAVIFNTYIQLTGLDIPQRKLLHLFSVFFTGTTLYLTRDCIPLNKLLASTAGVALLITTFFSDAFFVVYVIALPYLTLYLAYKITGPILKFNQLGDLSYGIYIFAFPIQQMIMLLQPETGVAGLMIKASFFTLICAALSWHLIEKPSLRFKFKLISSYKN